MSAAAAMIVAVPKATTAAGSTTSRRRNENLRCSIASGIAPLVRRNTASADGGAERGDLAAVEELAHQGRRREPARRLNSAPWRGWRRRRSSLLDAVTALDDRGPAAGLGHHQARSRRGWSPPRIRRSPPGRSRLEDDVDDQVEGLGEYVATGGEAGAAHHGARQARRRFRVSAGSSGGIGTVTALLDSRIGPTAAPLRRARAGSRSSDGVRMVGACRDRPWGG